MPFLAILTCVPCSWIDKSFGIHPENSTWHRDLIDSGQGANRRQWKIHEMIALEVTAAHALRLASLPEEPLDEFSDEAIS